MPRVFYKEARSTSEFRLTHFYVHRTELCRLLSLSLLCSASSLACYASSLSSALRHPSPLLCVSSFCSASSRLCSVSFRLLPVLCLFLASAVVSAARSSRATSIFEEVAVEPAGCNLCIIARPAFLRGRRRSTAALQLARVQSGNQLQQYACFYIGLGPQHRALRLRGPRTFVGNRQLIDLLN